MPQISAQDWVKVLSKRLDDRYPMLMLYQGYYDGDQTLNFASQKFRAAFGTRFAAFADNFCRLVINGAAERLRPEGFRLGEDPAEGEWEGDKDAWAMWQANHLDADSQLAQVQAMVKGIAYALVQPGTKQPQITIEDASQMICAHDVENRRNIKAAFKRWRDDSGYLFSTLYLPERIIKLQSDKTYPEDFGTAYNTVRWTPRGSGTSSEMANPLKEVPVVPFVNEPDLAGNGISDLGPVVPLQDAINKLIADMMVASEFGSFRQRWATGIEIPEDPETHQPIEPFQAAVDRLWVTRSETAHFGEFGQTDLVQFIRAVEMLIQHVASITHTPPHYLLGSMGSFPSGESLKASETGLVSKVRKKMLHFGEAWEGVMRLAFKVKGDPRADTMDSAEIIWSDPESRTEAEHADALVKLSTLGIPQEALWEMIPATPQTIARWKAMREEAAKKSQIEQPTTGPASPINIRETVQTQPNQPPQVNTVPPPPASQPAPASR